MVGCVSSPVSHRTDEKGARRQSRALFFHVSRMSYTLAPGLFHCRAGTARIFLDIHRDRFFQLSRDLEADFQAIVAGQDISGQGLAALVARGILAPVDRCATSTQVDAKRPGTVDLPVPLRVADGLHGETTLFETARALWADSRIKKRIGRHGLHCVLASLSHPKGQNAKGPLAAVAIDDRLPVIIISAFERAKLFRTPANRCLSRSIALVERLTAHGCAAHLVIGVRAIPFAAHSWVQVGDTVLNDTPEEVARFTPILAR